MRRVRSLPINIHIHAANLVTNVCIADTLWTALDASNQSLAKKLLQLSDLYTSDTESYIRAVKYISALQFIQVRVL